MPPKIADIAVPLPMDRTFHYAIPASLASGLQVGMRVLVPFGRRKITGYVIGFAAEPETPDVKEIIELLDAEPLFTPQQLELFRWVATYYLFPLGEVIKTALPGGINVTSRKGEADLLTEGEKVKLEPFYEAVPAAGDLSLGPRAKEVLAWLEAVGESSLSAVRAAFPSPHAQLNRLLELGLISRIEREVYRDPFRDEAVERDVPLVLNFRQLAALEQLVTAISSHDFVPFLLHGITGSGKTEVYLQAIAHALSLGKQALVLVPEIALTPQVVKRFRRRFDCGIAVLHSGLSAGERFDEWRRIVRGEVAIVIGARSAIYAPLADLGIIVVDEEHEASYKQSEGLRYNARDLALVRGKQEKAVVLLASATPLLTSFHAALEGRLGYLELPGRVRGLPMPDIEVLDRKGKKADLILPELKTAMEENLAAGGQTLLFLNRRGFATYLICNDCGHVLRCPNCSVTLTFHKRLERHVCHYCDYSLPAPSVCGACNGGNIVFLGQGTERIEEEVRAMFPDAVVARMDRDTTSGKGGHARVLKGLEEGTTDILIGTQMITKGHDFPGVTLVGVISADDSLHVPDFRSAERTFQLLTQVIGRAGRGDMPGRVLIQTHSPDHYAVLRAVSHDYRAFHDEEMGYRREAEYPPFTHLATVIFTGTAGRAVEAEAALSARVLRKLASRAGGGVEVMGPATAPLARVRGRFRWQLLIKGVRRQELHWVLAEFRRSHVPPMTVRRHIDIDPVDMM